MSDNYPRVTNDPWSEGDPYPWRSVDDGDFKVVPADAIVIERSELPEVTVSTSGKRTFAECDGGWGDYGITPDDTPERLTSHAYAILALSEYRRAHPPVDPALVQQIRTIALAADVTLSGTQVDTIARYFAATGRVHVDTEDGAL